MDSFIAISYDNYLPYCHTKVLTAGGATEIFLLAGKVLPTDIRRWSEKFSVSTTDGNSIGKMFFPPSWYIFHKHPGEITSHSSK
jgi:hypothetical protein